ncbi:hypothetical protein Daus18300_000858 [Diaporthe australafricana]|uniref:F-box domain-containing protein n=1 Tax=Diaporthe australafricana TaxID=127596 RepID=A0ABR3Y1F3_9PEZI
MELEALVPQRIVRVAARLDGLPVELVEPVLKDLSLRRVLQLATTPTADSPTSRLREILEGSASWGTVFRVKDRRPQRIWKSLSQFAWMWNRQHVQQVTLFNNSDLSLSSDELFRAHGPGFGPKIVDGLERTFVLGFKQILGIRDQHDVHGLCLTKGLLDAICLFVPTDVLQAIGTITDGHIPEIHSPMNSVLLNEVKSEQLLWLAESYDRCPGWLKVPIGPQDPAPRNNVKHIGDGLRTDAHRIRAKMPLYRQARRANGMDWYRFRYSHPVLIPTDKALQIFTASRSSPYPRRLLEDARRAVEGLWYIHGHDGHASPEARCVRDKKTMQVRHVVRTNDRRADPSPAAELDWLHSLLRCVWWSDHQVRANIPRPLLEPADYRQFIESEDSKVIAKQLLADFELSKQDATNRTVFPSLTALYMPSFSALRTQQVALIMWPELVDNAVRQIYWEDAVHKLRRHLAKAPLLPEHEDGNVLACDATPDQEGIDDTTRQYVTATASKKSNKWEQVHCYVCRLRIQKRHKIFAAMCHPCGEFNLAGSSASLPHNLNLEGRTALVTGARVNLGFHAALRLLRCGASVIASTRYPRDAVARYREQPDAANWMHRLRVAGADFRTASDAFALVGQTKSILQEWGGGLDILINNAAQTLTDSVGTEEAAVAREVLLKGDAMPMLVSGGYEARVWRGAAANNALGEADSDGHAQGRVAMEVSAKPVDPEMTGLEGSALSQHVTEENGTTTGTIVKPPEPSSWVQSLSEIPYEDVITAHSINTFVPLILIRELLPMMDHRKQDDSRQAQAGYIVNVSSREGIFEVSAKHRAKNGKHVHTNMSKAGLNMITETEASNAWQKYRVCMNTVDPGYMSAAPEYEQAYGGERPLGWEDGAGRVLWPIAMGEENQEIDREMAKMGPIWGRFLKHYGAVRVDTRVGRG